MSTNSKDLAALIAFFTNPKHQKNLGDLLQGIFTPKEITEFATRLQIVKMLKNKVSQRTIAASLGVGVATITRGAKEVELGRFIEAEL